MGDAAPLPPPPPPSLSSGDIPTKLCRPCGRYLPVTYENFTPNARTKDGFAAQCRKCHRQTCRKWYGKNKQSVKEKTKARLQAVRNEVLRHYSGSTPACACCGESALEFLAVDHIDGGGTQHRKAEILGKYTTFHCYLKAKGFPEGYRVLCHNCNSSLGYYGYCPHDNTRLREAS